MGYYEENVLYKDSFTEAISAAPPLERSEKNEQQTIPISSAGMFEMAKRYDFVKGKFADAFFKTMGPADGVKFKRFREKAQMLGERFLVELEDDD